MGIQVVPDETAVERVAVVESAEVVPDVVSALEVVDAAQDGSGVVEVVPYEVVQMTISKKLLDVVGE